MQAKIIGWLFGSLGQQVLVSILIGTLERLRPLVDATATDLDDKLLDCLLAALREHVADK